MGPRRRCRGKAAPRAARLRCFRRRARQRFASCTGHPKHPFLVSVCARGRRKAEESQPSAGHPRSGAGLSTATRSGTRPINTNGAPAAQAVRATNRPISVCGSAAIAHPSIAYRATSSTQAFFSSTVGVEDPMTHTRPPRYFGFRSRVSRMKRFIVLPFPAASATSADTPVGGTSTSPTNRSSRSRSKRALTGRSSDCSPIPVFGGEKRSLSASRTSTSLAGAFRLTRMRSWSAPSS